MIVYSIIIVIILVYYHLLIYLFYLVEVIIQVTNNMPLIKKLPSKFKLHTADGRYCDVREFLNYCSNATYYS